MNYRFIEFPCSRGAKAQRNEEQITHFLQERWCLRKNERESGFDFSIYSGIIDAMFALFLLYEKSIFNYFGWFWTRSS